MGKNAMVRSRYVVTGAMAAFLFLPLGARAASIALDTYTLAPDQAGQNINIYVSGGDDVRGVNLEIFVADGGPDANGTTAGPKISAVDLFAPGAVFALNNTGYLQYSATSAVDFNATESQFFEVTTTTQTDTVALGSSTNAILLAVVTVDTTGFMSGDYALTLDNPASPTNFSATGGQGPTNPTVQDGTIHIGDASSTPPTPIPTPAPEPSSLALLAMGIPALLTRKFKR